ncbi:MAG: heat-inducible transcriptional repressor HrcA [Pseudomonadota bacterium]
MNFNLSQRDSEVLEMIITDYIASARPVASNAISKHYIPRLSPATIRNVMSELTTLGLISQPHTSAGRIPTNQGLRYFVDSMLEFGNLCSEDERMIRERFNEPQGGIKSLLTQASQALATFTKHVGLVSAPVWNDVVFKRIEFIRLSKSRLLGIFVGQDGRVQNRIIEVSEDFSLREVDKINSYCNNAFHNLTLDQAKTKVRRELDEHKIDYDHLIAKAFTFADQIFNKLPLGELMVDGETHLLDASRMNEVEKIKKLMQFLDEKESVLKLLDRCKEAEGVKIFIGAESGDEALTESSIVTAPYSQGGKIVGTIGVIGPTYMNYSKTISVVDFTAKLLSDLLDAKE